MKFKISSGVDEILWAVLKLLEENILWGLSHIFNLSLSQGIIYCIFFKVAKIVRVYKMGKKTDVNSYKPISLLFVFSKVFEKIVYKKLYSCHSK